MAFHFLSSSLPSTKLFQNHHLFPVYTLQALFGDEVVHYIRYLGNEYVEVLNLFPFFLIHLYSLNTRQYFASITSIPNSPTP